MSIKPSLFIHSFLPACSHSFSPASFPSSNLVSLTEGTGDSQGLEGVPSAQVESAEGEENPETLCFGWWWVGEEVKLNLHILSVSKVEDKQNSRFDKS